MIRLMYFATKEAAQKELSAQERPSAQIKECFVNERRPQDKFIIVEDRQYLHENGEWGEVGMSGSPPI